MAKILTSNKNYYDIANTIRQMKNVNTTYKPRQMASALKDIYSNEVEGTLPLSFEANGNDLLNYRIDGASGGVGERTNNLFDKKNTEIIHAYFSPENLWQVNEDSSSIIIKVRPNTQYTLSIGTEISIFRIYKTSLENPEPGKNNVFTPIIRSSNIKTYTFTTDNDITYIIFQGTNADTEMWINSLIFNIGSTSLPSYEPYGYKVPVVVSGKNLFNENAITNEILRDNDGTTNSNNNWRCSNFINIPQNNNNILISWESDSAYFQAKIAFYDNQKNFISLSNYGINNTYLITFNLPNNCEFIRFSYSQTVNNVPANRHNIQIILGSTPTDYEPYIEPTTTNIYLDEPILENESISLSDTNVNIPTIDGTNVITIDTTVQPSNVYIQAPKDTPKMVEARERLEAI